MFFLLLKLVVDRPTDIATYRAAIAAKKSYKMIVICLSRAINWLYVVNMEISMVKTKVGCYGNQILALQPCGGNPYGA